jgi:glycosyltransferase involved in cell wall biosynthesis
LISHEIFPPEVAGGGERLALRLTRELIKRGHEVKVVTTGDPKIKKFDGIETVRIPVNRYMMNIAWPKITTLASKSDIIQTSSGNSAFPSWAAAKIARKPVCCTVCHIFGPNWNEVLGPLKGGLFSFMERQFLIRDFDKIMFLNKSSRNIGKDMGIEMRRAMVINPGIDHKRFQMKRIKKEPFVLSVGNFSFNRATAKIKGTHYLIDAAKKLPDVKFKFRASGKYVGELKRIAPPNIEFIERRLSEKELIRLYNKAMVFCAPSLAEGFGFTILEAMASGCAVVSSINLGQKGRVIKPRSSDEIAKTVKGYLDNPKKASKDGKENRRISKKFNWDRFVDSYERVYEKLT